MDILFIPCNTLKELGIDTDYIEHQCENGTKFLLIRHEQENQAFVLVEINENPMFSDVSEQVKTLIPPSRKKSNKRPISLKINMNYYDVLVQSTAQINYLGRFIADFKKCLENCTK